MKRIGVVAANLIRVSMQWRTWAAKTGEVERSAGSNEASGRFREQRLSARMWCVLEGLQLVITNGRRRRKRVEMRMIGLVTGLGKASVVRAQAASTSKEHRKGPFGEQLKRMRRRVICVSAVQ
jgi:hypothetical protein